MSELNVVVAGGGTAGHIEPALAVAETLEAQGAKVIALGTPRGLESTIVPQRGFPLELIDPVPVPRKLNAELLKLPWKVLKTVRQARAVFRRHETQVVVGFGGYVSASAYLAARSLRIPVIVHEANARAGMANKLGRWLGGTGLNAVEGSGMPGEVVGIPIKQLADPQAAERAAALWKLDPGRPTVLVTGGSQGASSINRAVSEGIDAVLAEGYQVLHSYGNKNAAPQARPGYVPVPYIDDMAAAYAIADLVVCRAGAMTVAENTAAGVPAIYVPLPHGNGEQGLNAAPVVEAGGARIIEDAQLTGEAFSSAVREILGSDAVHAAMVAATRSSGMGNASERIAQIVFEQVAP